MPSYKSRWFFLVQKSAPSNVKAHVLFHFNNCVFLWLTNIFMTFTGLELECPQPYLLIPRRTFQEHHIPQCPGLGCVAGLPLQQRSTLLLWIGWIHESTPTTRQWQHCEAMVLIGKHWWNEFLFILKSIVKEHSDVSHSCRHFNLM